MAILLYIIISCFIISLASLAGVFFLGLKKTFLEKILLSLLSLAAGIMIASAFLHLLPEAAEHLPGNILFLILLISFIFFFFIERLFHWHHCHKDDCQVKPVGYLSLLGDGVHNFIDGLVIAASFLVDIKLGIATSLAVALHEIPSEIGDFSVLIHAGFGVPRALLFNFLTALIAIAGGIAGYFLSLRIEGLATYLLPVAAGSFLYIAASDLIPEIHKERDFRKSIFPFLFFLLGAAIMYIAKLFN